MGDFDEAFASRIHLSLYYPALDLESTKNVLKTNFKLIRDRMGKRGKKTVIDEGNILQFAVEYFHKHERARWNGRQIRNACLTALALAEHEHQQDSKKDPEGGIVLGRDQFEQVGEANLEFYLHREAVTGLDTEEWA